MSELFVKIAIIASTAGFAAMLSLLPKGFSGTIPFLQQFFPSKNVLRIAPMLNDLKSYLDKLAKNLEKEEEPELLKAVNYALTEYPCMLRCLEDGSLDLSNNVCERQIRRIAKYRNNSYFVGSPESGVRFARLMSHFANIRKHNLEPMEYLCDVFRRIKNTAKDKLVDLLAHRWQLATVTAWE